MDYPKDFDTPTFPAGRAIAVSRTFSIWTAIVFFLIMCSCGLMLLLVRSKNNYPFLISTDPITADWTVIAYPEKDREITATELVQENLVKKYVEYWFNIEKNSLANEALWQRCSEADCASEQFNPTIKKCALFCSSASDLFQNFVDNVVPRYRAKTTQNSETVQVIWQMITPPAKGRAVSNLWQSIVTLYSSVDGYFDAVAFIELDQQYDKYPATFGWFVKNFNSYKISIQTGAK